MASVLFDADIISPKITKKLELQVKHKIKQKMRVTRQNRFLQNHDSQVIPIPFWVSPFFTLYRKIIHIGLPNQSIITHRIEFLNNISF